MYCFHPLNHFYFLGKAKLLQRSGIASTAGAQEMKYITLS